ncbi:WD40-repeat-containing domain protein, partial [Catenaria anguillulae PL171]
MIHATCPESPYLTVCCASRSCLLDSTDEFPAHSSQVTCLRVGQRHGNILVTGGDDRKVHLWEVGNTNPLLTLAGHTHAVTGIAIDSPEHLVVAGCSNGSLKLWDLEQGKAIRSFMGHRSAIDKLHFHPLDDFFVSATSGEPSVKVWDLKRKTSVLTITNPTGLHADLVRFTPDGRYLLTSNYTSQSTGSSTPVCANVWDMSTGRLVHRFLGSPAYRICFHPRELVMSTLATDGSLTVWDMETYGIISQGPAMQDASVYPLFTLDGSQLLGLAADSVAMYNWDPHFAHASTMPVAPASPTAWADAVVVPVGNAEHIVAAGISDSYVHVMQMHM